MKKLISILLVILSIVFIFAGCGKNSDTAKLPNSEDLQPVEGYHNVEYFVDNSFTSKISFDLSDDWKEKYTTLVSSSHEKGHYFLQVCHKAEDGTKTPLFGIYCSKNDSYKEYEDFKNYEILKTTEKYTYVWFEYEVNNKDDKTINTFLSQLNEIKESAKNKTI